MAAAATVTALNKQQPARGLRKTPAGLAAALTALDVAWRWNIRACRPEFAVGGERWTPATDLFMDSLRMEIAGRFVTETKDGTAPLHFGQERWASCLNSLLYEVRIDPFRQWLEHLEPWDGTKRLDHWMTWCFNLVDKPDELTRWACRALFMGCVARTYEPSCKQDETVVLHGPRVRASQRRSGGCSRVTIPSGSAMA